MKVTKRKLKKIIEEELEKIHHNTSLMEDVFTDEEKQKYLKETSLSRVKDKAENQMIPFVMISAFRGNLSRKENLKRQKELEARFEASPSFSWNKMPGSGYVEEPEEEGGSPNEVKENSILVWAQNREGEAIDPKLLFDRASQVAGDFNQDSFIYGAPEEAAGQTAMTARVYAPGGGLIKEPWAGPWHTIQQAAEDDFYWSVMGSKRTKLVGIKESYKKSKAGSFMGAVKKQYYIEAIDSALNWIDNREQKQLKISKGR
tara:strand:- start:204 stop:980 length:777 start_codon:yes stop_codon:yes gene_type:complete